MFAKLFGGSAAPATSRASHRTTLSLTSLERRENPADPQIFDDVINPESDWGGSTAPVEDPMVKIQREAAEYWAAHPEEAFWNLIGTGFKLGW